MSTIWNETEAPPKDRSIVLHGAICVQYEFGAEKIPLLCIAHFDESRGLWVDDEGMAIRQYVDGELQCYAWADLPKGEGKPITLELPLSKAPTL